MPRASFRTFAITALFLFMVAPARVRGVARGEKKEIAVAAAANLTGVMERVGAAFEQATGIHPVFSFGSTARLTQQIISGAPWDMFAAADTEHVEQLERRGLLTPGTRAVYATGILALWIPSARMPVQRAEDLTNAAVRVVALANPKLAPYGLAARETLQKLGIWEAVQPRVVYAENIRMAKQYGATGNADAVFTALALVKEEAAGRVMEIPERWHAPIRQALGIVAASKKQAFARQFAEFLLTGEGRRILLESGYR